MAILPRHERSGYDDYVRCSRWYSFGGIWSGSEGRYKKRYIALIPISRYKDQEPVPGDLAYDCAIYHPIAGKKYAEQKKITSSLRYRSKWEKYYSQFDLLDNLI